MKYLICFVILLTISTSFLECKKSKSQSCGCNSPVIETYNSLIGDLEYNFYTKQYSINGGGNSIDGRVNIICDTSIPGLQPFLDSARIFNPTVTVSGQVREYCTPDTISFMGEVRNISITKISY